MFIKGERTLPKILDVSKDKILEIADSILKTDGYKALSVRKLADMCGIATGTFYLYFPSKEDLVAQAIVKTWTITLADMKKACSEAVDFAEGIVFLYSTVCSFSQKYRLAFKEYSKHVGSLDALHTRHIMLREQLSDCISVLARATGQHHLLTNTDMIAECVLAVTTQRDMDENTLREFIKLIVK